MHLPGITVTTNVAKENTLCSVWIEDLEGQSSSTLYRTLIQYQKSVFEDHDRFIFYNFMPVDTGTLDHVKQILEMIDIPNWFVTVITNQIATKRYFESLHESIRVVWQDQPLEHTTIKITQPLFNTQKTMCVHAWAGFHALPQGDVRLCCTSTDKLKNNNGEFFNIRFHSADEIINSNHVKSLRNEFKQGKIPSGCNSCVAIEQHGGTSKRQLSSHKLENLWGYIDWESDSVDDVRFIGAHIGNLCNLKCRICNESFSSSIAAEKLSYSKLNKKQDPVYITSANNSWKSHIADFYNNLKKMNNLCNFEFLGGEPLLLKENLNFMQWLISSNKSKNCMFEFVTNGTQYHDMFDSDKYFKRLLITVSIDDLYERFEYQRSGASWSQMTANLAKFVKNSSIIVGVSITVNIQNVLYLPELIRWLNTQGVDHYFYNLLTSPSWVSIDQLTPEAKQLAINKLSNANLPPPHQEKLNFIVNQLSAIQTSDGQEFIKNIIHLDKIRNENFIVSHKDIAIAMGFVLT